MTVAIVDHRARRFHLCAIRQIGGGIGQQVFLAVIGFQPRAIGLPMKRARPIGVGLRPRLDRLDRSDGDSPRARCACPAMWP
jgi:hypothetical protein